MVQILHPVDPLAHKPRMSSFRCSPLTRRRTLPSIRDLALSQSWRQNAIERAAIRKFTTQLAHCASPVPKLLPFISLPAVFPADPSTLVSPPVSEATPGISVQAEPPEEIPGTPATPIETQECYPESQPEPKANIFNANAKSDALLDLTIAALHRIYIDDYSQDTWSTETQVYNQPSATLQVPSWPKARASVDHYELSPPSICGSAVSSVNSTPSSNLPTPYSSSPEFDPEISYAHQSIDSNRIFANAVPAAVAKPVTRTHSAPVHIRVTQAPTLGDKKSLHWFLFELLGRSRSSASVVQLALHYLAQARKPVGDILRRRFKSETRQGEEDGLGKGEDSPLLDPRKLLLAALMLSTKLLHDHTPNNRAWSRVCGLEPRDVGACERALCQALNWNLANMLVGPRDEQPVVV